jgi:hypothetical protein
MKEEYIYMQIGGTMLKLTRISYQEYLKNLRLDSKYLIYYDGDGYYRLPKMGTEEARRNQLIQNWNRITEIKQERFPVHFSWIAIYTYNMLLDFKKEIPIQISQWARAVERWLATKNITEFERHAISKVNITLSPRITGHSIDNILAGNIRDFAWLWIEELSKGRIDLYECGAPDCFKVYIKAGGSQKYCSRRCKNRTAERRYRKEEKERLTLNKI